MDKKLKIMFRKLKKWIILFFKPITYNWVWSVIGLIIFIFLFAGYIHKYQSCGNCCFPDKLWDFIDPVSAILTFIITLVILYNQANEKWKNSLEKRLDVDYIFNPKEGPIETIAKVKNAYLAGESDIRPWAQQLGRQMFKNLDFDMNWDEDTNHDIKKNPTKNNEYYISYKVTIYLTSNPLTKEEGKEALENFLSRDFKHSRIKNDNLPIIWERID